MELRAPATDNHQEEPSLAVLPGGRVVVAWKEMPQPATVGSLGLARSDDEGLSWQTSLLPRPVGGAGQSDPWLVARASGRVLAARYAACGVAVAASDDEGASWSTWQEMHAGDGCADKPSLSRARTGPLVLVYHVIETSGDDVRVDLAMSRNDGNTWTASEIVAPEAGERRLAPTAAVLADGSVAVAWWRPDIGGVEVTRSNDDGDTWSTPTSLNSKQGSVIRIDRPELRPPFPTLTALGNTLVAAWSDAGSGDWNVVASRSEDGGRSWSAPLPLDSGGSGDQWMVTVAAGPD
ncbi:MAG: sialidase family protein, partial [Halobacteriales archaeon]|nr:sialidase family protein [Halobacteriales archaeon]